MKHDFIPIKLVKIDAWEDNFLKTLTQQAASLGITPEQLTELTQKITDHRAAYAEADAAKKAAKSKVAHMKTLKTNTIRSIRKVVRQIKSSPNYTETNGKTLGVIGPENSTELTRPKMKVKVIGGRPVISYKKYHSHGVFIYSKRGTEKQLTLLAADSRSPYVDTRPNINPTEPEKREYAAYYMLNDEPIGEIGNTSFLLVAADAH